MSAPEASTAASPLPLRDVRALLFDVFGTVVDWRTTVQDELVERARAKRGSAEFRAPQQEDPDDDDTPQSRFARLTDADWAAFAQDWRDSYGRYTRGFVPGVTPWKDIDAHHRDSLAELLAARGVSGVYADAEVDDLSRVWHRLAPWPDAAPGLVRLGRRLVTATLSNGNQELLRDLDAHARLGFRRLISAADFEAYKPHPKTYLGAAAALGLEPAQCAMVAAHLSDLEAARSHGLRTVYVERRREEAWPRDGQAYREARDWVDVWVAEDEEGFVEVARRLGIPES